MNIGFYSNQLSFRGTEVAMFDYAYYNETLLKNKSFIFYEKNNLNNDIDVIKKFNNFLLLYLLIIFTILMNICKKIIFKFFIILKVEKMMVK